MARDCEKQQDYIMFLSKPFEEGSLELCHWAVILDRILSSVKRKKVTQSNMHVVNMADMGFGLTREDVMQLAYKIAEKTGKQHPFHNGSAGRSWFEAFRARHPKLTFRTPQPLSYCRALCSNEETIGNFFSKLGAIYGKLDLFTKPKQVFNVDETGVSIVHKPGKVLVELGRRNVYALTSAEKGKTHTVLICVSASGFYIPPLMIYPRKQRVPDHMKEGALPNSVFEVSESGWINQDIYLKWFDFFINSIPPARPVLLIQDGHGSHISIELIEKARANDIHLLCLPAHTTHLLRPLDIGVFKPFKTHFNKACQKYMRDNSGQVITPTILAPTVAEALTNSLTPLNILSGFKKCAIHPLNPGEVKDRQLAPSKAVRFKQSESTPQDASKSECTASDASKPKSKSTGAESTPTDISMTKLTHTDASTTKSTPPESRRWSPETIALYQVRFEEGYDMGGLDPDYTAWLNSGHPDIGKSVSPAASVLSGANTSSSSDVLGDILVYPKPSQKSTSRKRKPALNSQAVCITEESVLEQLRAEEEEKKLKATEKEKQKLDNKRKERQLENRRLKKRKRRLKKQKRKLKKSLREGKGGRKPKRVEEVDIITRNLRSCTIKGQDKETRCPVCNVLFDDSSSIWMCCDKCNLWYNLECTNMPEDSIPDSFYCDRC